MFDNLDNLKKQKDQAHLGNGPASSAPKKDKGINFLPSKTTSPKSGLFGFLKPKEKTDLHQPAKIKTPAKQKPSEKKASLLSRFRLFFIRKKKAAVLPTSTVPVKKEIQNKFSDLLFLDDLQNNLPPPPAADETAIPKVIPPISPSKIPFAPPASVGQPKLAPALPPFAKKDEKPAHEVLPPAPSAKEFSGPVPQPSAIIKEPAPDAKKELGQHDVLGKEKEADEMAVNLLPDRKFFLNDQQIVLTYIFVIFICALVIGMPYNYFRLKNNQVSLENEVFSGQLEQIETKNKELNKQIAAYGPLSKKIKQLLPLLDNHVYWSQFLPVLEKHTVRNVYFDSLDISADGLISLTGNAWQLRDLAEQLIVIENSPAFSELKLDSLTFLKPELPTDPAVSFTVSFLLDAKILSADYLTLKP